jgi:hypothetical protein
MYQGINSELQKQRKQIKWPDMNKVIRLDFFEETDMSVLKAEVAQVRDSCNRVRRKQFAEIGELRRMMIELTQRLEIIERNICNGK